ncbi:MAG: hypothetical protein K2Y37_26270 [Pirellulales bacterium]|nr:hypothetical protein [Pirellulales bacterium]
MTSSRQPRLDEVTSAKSNRLTILVFVAMLLDGALWGSIALTGFEGSIGELRWNLAFVHITLAACWFVAADARLFTRLIVLAGADLLYAGVVGGRNNAVMLLATALVHQVALVVVYFALARLRVAPRLVRSQDAAASDQTARRNQISLKELFVMATLLAVVMAAGRWFNLQVPDLPRAWIVQVVLAALALGILGILMPPKCRVWRIAVTSALLVMPAIVYVRWDWRPAGYLAVYGVTIGCAGLIWLGAFRALGVTEKSTDGAP